MKTEHISLPSSWHSLTWQQLYSVWQIKMRYGGNSNVARVAVLLSLIHTQRVTPLELCSKQTGEKTYILKCSNGKTYMVTPRELAMMAKKSLAWVDFPYGDVGEKEQKDANGKVITQRREPHPGYVSPVRDAMVLPEEFITVSEHSINISSKKWTKCHFCLPQLAMSNISWQQYRALQAVVAQLFTENISQNQTIILQAQFLAHMLAPRSLALIDTNGGSIRIRPHFEYMYNAEHAEKLVHFWKKLLSQPKGQHAHTLFHILFQCYQTTVSYYSQAYPLLFAADSKNNEMRDALQGEVSTVNTIMKYAGYSEQKQVYDSNVPFVLDILNSMAREAKEIEKMNAKIKRK